MNWMFWKSDGQAKKLPGPKELPQRVGTYLVVQEKMSPDLVWTLSSVAMPRPSEKDVVDVRVYNDSAVRQAGLKVENYHSLDDHPDVVIFDGWYNKDTGIVYKKAS